MAGMFSNAFDETLVVSRGSGDASTWQAVQIRVGLAGSICLSREESAKLESDLHAINAVGATPVEVSAAA